MNLDRMAATAGQLTPGRPTAAVVTLLRWVVRPVFRIAFRPRLEGLEHLPLSGAFLLVGNHPSSMGIAELMSFAVLYLDRFGTSRPLAGFAHPFAFHVWPISPIMRGLGAIPSTYAGGEAALAAGIPLLVFPGGDYEGTLPIWRTGEVDFGGRVGFLKLARGAAVPIVPLAFRGSRFTAPVVWQSRWLSYVFVAPRVLGMKRYPMTLLAVLGAVAIVFGLPQLGPWRFLLAWAWFASPLTLVPWIPWPVRARIGQPLPPETLFAEGGDDLRPALARVEAAVRAELR